MKPLSIGHIHTEAAALAFSDVARPRKVCHHTRTQDSRQDEALRVVVQLIYSTSLHRRGLLGRSTLNQMSMQTSSVDEPKRIVQQA